MQDMTDQSVDNDSATNYSFDLNTENADQDTGSLSQTTEDSSLSQSRTRNTVPSQAVGSSSHTSSDSSRMARQTGNSVPLNANSQEFVPGTYLYNESSQGYLHPSGMHFNAHGTMNGSSPYEFHRYYQPTWFNGSPSPPNVPQMTVHLWIAVPGANRPNSLATNQQISLQYHFWLIDLPIYAYFGAPSMSQSTQTYQGMEVQTDTVDVRGIRPEFNEVVYGDEGNPSQEMRRYILCDLLVLACNIGSMTYEVVNQFRISFILPVIEVDQIDEEILALQERVGTVNVAGLDDETIEELLERRHYDSDANDSSDAEREICSICLEEYAGGEDIGRLDCGHEFHASCVKEWLLRKNECPVCKSKALASR